MYSWILLGVVALIILICAGFAAIFGLAKAKARVIITAVCAAASLFACWMAKVVLPSPDVIMSFVKSNMSWIRANFGEDVVVIVKQAFEYASLSPTLAELLVQLVTALVLPLLFVLLFLVLFAVTWLVFLIVFGIVRAARRRRAARRMDDDDEEPRKSGIPRLLATGLGAMQGVLLVMIILIPFTCYLSIAQPMLHELNEQGLLPNDQPVVEQVQLAVDEMSASPSSRWTMAAVTCLLLEVPRLIKWAATSKSTSRGMTTM